MFKFKFILIAFTIVIVLLGVTYFVIDEKQEPYDVTDHIMNSIPGTYIKLSKGITHYELIGSDTGKLVVLIHGAGSGYYAWDNNFHYLISKGFKVLRYDLYGRGFSSRPYTEYTIDLFHHQLDELLDSLKLPRKQINLVGVSMGATVAIDYADKHKESINHLILIDPASKGMGKAPFYISTPIVSDLLFTFYWRPKAVEKQMNEFFNPNSVAEYRTKTEKQMLYRGFKRAIKSTWIHTLSLDMTNQMAEIGKSKHIKTHLIWGKSDPLISYKAASEYQKLLPASSLDVIENAGHLSNYEQPDSVNVKLFRCLQNER